MELWWDPFIKSRRSMSLKFTRSYISWQWTMMQYLRKNWLVSPNWREEFNKSWPEHSKISKIFTLTGCFWAKCVMFELRKFIESMFDDTEHWYKTWRKTELCFQKWHGKFDKFSPEHSEASKLGLWWYVLIQSRKSMSLKFTGELRVLTMKNLAKFEEELNSWGIWWPLTWAI